MKKVKVVINDKNYMMYGGFDVFKTYLAVKNHFTTDYNYQNMVVELQQNWKVLLKDQIDISFINYLKDIMNEIYWIILLVILLLTVINGLVI